VSLNSLQVLAYFAIFRYPLTKKEISRYVELEHSPETKFHTLKNIAPINRFQRNKTSRQKTILTKQIVQPLTKIPFIQFIGLTGAIAANNAKPNDDIDLLIITRPHTLWLTRLIANFYLNLKNLRRTPNSCSTKNKLCLNLWLDQQALKLSHSHQNIYSAFELTLIKPLFDRNNIYEQFLHANRNLLKKYFSNFKIPSSQKQKSFEFCAVILRFPLFVFNFLSYLAQRLYMAHRLTNEKVSLHYAFFHPCDLAPKIIKKYHQICQKHKIPSP